MDLLNTIIYLRGTTAIGLYKMSSYCSTAPFCQWFCCSSGSNGEVRMQNAFKISEQDALEHCEDNDVVQEMDECKVC